MLKSCLYVIAGSFDPFETSTNPYDSIDLSQVGAHAGLAREAAEQAMTLLKNDGNLLPLSKTTKLAFVGPHANSTLDLLGKQSNPHLVIILTCMILTWSCLRQRLPSRQQSDPHAVATCQRAAPRVKCAVLPWLCEPRLQ